MDNNQDKIQVEALEIVEMEVVVKNQMVELPLVLEMALPVQEAHKIVEVEHQIFQLAHKEI